MFTGEQAIKPGPWSCGANALKGTHRYTKNRLTDHFTRLALRLTVQLTATYGYGEIPTKCHNLKLAVHWNKTIEFG